VEHDGSAVPEWALRAIDAALDAIITIDASGRVVQFNTAAETMFGYSRDEAVGELLAELIIPPDLRAAHRAGLARLVAGKEGRILDRRIEMRALLRDGEEVPVELAVTRAGDSPPMFTGFVRDLRPLREAADRESQAASLLEAAEELVHMGSWELDLRTGEARWSEELYRIYGFEPGEAEPGVELVLECLPPEDRQAVRTLLTTVVERPEEIPREGLTYEHRIVRSDGSVRHVVAHGQILRDEQDRPTRWVGTSQDVTDVQLRERELQAHYALSLALREWESFEEGTVGLLRRLGTALDFPLGALWTWDEAEEQLTCRAVWAAPDVGATEFELVTRGLSMRPGAGVPGRSWRTALPIVVPDVHEVLVAERRRAAEAIGVRSGLAFPAVGPDGPLAVLSFYSFDRREGSERLIRTLTGIGRELGRFLSRRRAQLGARPLTDREVEVLQLAAEGLSGPEIAERLFVSPGTVKTHFEHIYDKLGVGDRAGAVAYALRIGLIH
jgi:PAS domain S-box-containing protein